MKIFYTILAFLLLPKIALAAPSVSDVSGTLAHGQSVTISGSDFGMKATAAPAIWDDCSGTNPLDKWTTVNPNTGETGVSSIYATAYRTPTQVATGRGYGVSLPHSHATKYLAGCHYNPSNYSAYGAVMAWKTRNINSYPAHTYVSWYRQYDPDWIFSPSQQGTNNKFFVSGYGYPFDPNTWYIQYIAGYLSGGSATVYHNTGDDDGNNNWRYYGTCPCGNECDYNYKCSGPWGNIPPWVQTSDDGTHKQTAINPVGNWIKEEIEIRYAQDDSGFIKTYENGIKRYDYAGRTVRTSASSPLTIAEAIESYSDVWGTSQSNNWRYMSDIYLDYTLQRTEICPGQTWNVRGSCELQIPTAWSEGSISVLVNEAAFNDSQQAYLYVVDSTGAANASGYPVTFGSGGGDTTPPIAPGGLSVR